MKRIIGGILICAAAAMPTAAAAVPKNASRPTCEMDPGERTLARSASKAQADTFWFGGTHWDAADARWEANVSTSRTNRWTFDSGVAGPLEGWTREDLTFVPPPTLPPEKPDNADFRWLDRAKYHLYGTPGTELFPAATPPDTGAIWVGKFPEEAGALCYVAGQGYGNGWEVEAQKAFAYGGTGDVRLTYRYFNNTEKNFDFTYLYLEFDGMRETSARVVMTTALGAPTSKRTKILTVSAASIPAGTAEIAAVFRFTSDSGWSDEDGVGFTTPYGPFCCYSFAYEDLGAPENNDEDSFELGAEGWSFLQGPGVGAFTHVENIANLPPMLSACPCAGTVLQGNVLTQFDPATGKHPDGQDEVALSPYIDLEEAGVGAAPTKRVVLDTYQDLPLSNAVYFNVVIRAYPILCEATGQYIEADFRTNCLCYWPPMPVCYDEYWDDAGAFGAFEYCRVGLEVLSLCSLSTNCTNPGGNETPYYDNIALAVSGTPGAPAVGTTDRRPFLQDIFAVDGTLRPRSTCILDNSGDANFGTTASDADLEDTMYVTAAHSSVNGGVQVNLHFRYRKGPGTDGSHAFFARYPLENTWYEARCDSGRTGPVITEVWDTWCSEYHESSPYFAGENAEANEILPDRVFTPGSTIDYYWSASYVNTPATRNFWPDVPGGEEPLSVDLLPGMWADAGGDTLWPCALYVNGENRQPLGRASAYHLVQPALEAALGPYLNAGAIDRYDDVLVGSNTNAGLGRQLAGENGMSEIQSLAYGAIVMAYGRTETYTMLEDTARLLGFWLATNAGGANDGRQLLYLSGDGVAFDMSNPLKPAANELLAEYFGATFLCAPYRAAGCPTGSVADTTFCVRLAPAAGADPAFIFTGAPYRARGEACPNERRFSVLGVSGPQPGARPNLDYVDQDGPKGTTHYASITNDRGLPETGNFRTVLDGFSLSRLRRPVAAAWDCSSDSLAIVDRVRDVALFAAGPAPTLCPSLSLTDVDPSGADGVPRAPSLAIAPNPFNPVVKLSYAVAAPGCVTIRIFDVSGALVATLVDEAKTPGRYEALWRGMDGGGRRAASGVFWAKYAIGDNEITKQLVLLK